MKYKLTQHNAPLGQAYTPDMDPDFEN